MVVLNSKITEIENNASQASLFINDIQHISTKRMGGYGSGGWNSSGRPAVEQCQRLSIGSLRSASVLQLGACGIWRWGEFAVTYETRWDDMIVLSWNDSQNIYQEQFLGFQWLAHSRRYGGYQYYLVCPSCKRLCTSVYYVRRFACRKCHKLQYLSQRLSTIERLQRTGERLQEKIQRHRGKKRTQIAARALTLKQKVEFLILRYLLGARH